MSLREEINEICSVPAKRPGETGYYLLTPNMLDRIMLAVTKDKLGEDEVRRIKFLVSTAIVTAGTLIVGKFPEVITTGELDLIEDEATMRIISVFEGGTYETTT